jgi:HEAT repeat protein
LQPANSAFVRLGAISKLADPEWLPLWEREEAFGILVAATNDPDAIVRSSAGMVLTQCRDHAVQVVSLLIGLTHDKDAGVRKRSLFALESFRGRVPAEGDAIITAAVAALDDPKPDVRLEAGRALYVFGQGQMSVPADDSLFPLQLVQNAKSF